MISANFNEKFKPASDKVLADALETAKGLGFSNEYPCRGSQPETKRTSAFATIASTIAAGRRDRFCMDFYVDIIKRMFHEPRLFPDLSGSLNSRQHSPFVYAIAILWNDDEIASRFTKREREYLELFMRTALYSTTFTLSEIDENGLLKSAQGISIHGDDNCWNGGNPNYYEANLTLFYSASLTLGLERIESLLKEFDLDAFVAEVEEVAKEAKGFESVLNCYKSLRGGEAFSYRGDWNLKKAMLNGVINHTERWRFKGVGLREYLNDPMLLFYETQCQTFPHIAQDGDYIGSVGMEREFESTDNSGRRQNSGYVSYGIDPSLLNRLIMYHFGYWSKPENKERAMDIHSRHVVGVSDYYAKAINGYTDLSWGGMHISYITSIPSVYFLETMNSLGLLNEALFNDSFNYGEEIKLSSRWETVGDWRTQNGTILPFNIKKKDWSKSLQNYEDDIVTDPRENILTVYPKKSSIAWTKDSFCDVSYLAWVKLTENGEAGICARVKNSENYYLFSSDGEKIYIKKIENAVCSVLVEKALKLDTTIAHRFRAVVKADLLTFYIDGLAHLTANDRAFASGAIGLFADDTTASFDAVLVQNSI